MRTIGLLNRLKKITKFGTDEEEPASAEENASVDDVIEYALTGGKVDRNVAEKVAALNEGIALISDSISSMPIYLYKRDENGDREKVKGDIRNHLLNTSSSEYGTSFNTKKAWIDDFIWHGNGYIDINKDMLGKVKSLIHIPYKDISLNDSLEINKRKAMYSYDYWNMKNGSADQVMNLVRKPKDHELKGVGILEEGRDILSNAVGLDSYSKSTLDNGFFAKAIIEKEGVITKKSKESLQSAIKKFFAGKKNAGKVMILDDGLKLKTVSLSPADIELLQQKDFTVKDIARLLKMQPSMLGVATGGMTYSNESDNQLVFLKNTIAPLLTLIEQTLNKYLLTEDEKLQGYFFEVNTQHLLRTSPEKEMKMYAEAVKGSLMLISEGRRKVNLPFIEGTDRPLISLSTGILGEDGKVSSHLDSKQLEEVKKIEAKEKEEQKKKELEEKKKQQALKGGEN